MFGKKKRDVFDALFERKFNVLRLPKTKSQSKKLDVWDSLSFVAFFGCKKGFTSLETFSSSLDTDREYFRP